MYCIECSQNCEVDCYGDGFYTAFKKTDLSSKDTTVIFNDYCDYLNTGI